MLNNFIYAQTKELFLNALNNEQVLDEAIVFIEDTKEIWNRGHYFGGGVDEDVITNIQTSIANLDATKLSKTEADGLYALKEDIPDLEDYVTQSWIESNYLPKTGGTLTNPNEPVVLSLNSTAVSTALMLQMSGENKAYFGANSMLGAFICDYDSNNCIGVRPDGTPHYNGNNTLIHSGNYSNYALPLSGGTLSARLTIAAGSDKKIVLNNTDTDNKYQFISFQQNGTEYGQLGTADSDDLMWGKAGYEKVILHSGNIGSYNAGSATKLETARTIWGQSFDGTGDVKGHIYGSDKTFAIYGFDGTNNYNILDADTNNSNLWLGYGSAPKSYNTNICGNVIYLKYGTSRANGLILNSDGNVTIGSSDLAETAHKLCVGGPVKINGSIYFGVDTITMYGYDSSDSSTVNALYLSSVYKQLQIGSGTAAKGYNTYLHGNDLHLRYGTSRTTGLLLNSSGNVGIGTTDPQYKLDVNGSFNATSGSIGGNVIATQSWVNSQGFKTTWRDITDSVSTTSSTISGSATAVKTAYDKAVSAYNLANGKTSNTGTITGVTAGNGLTGGGTSGSVTLNVGAGAGISVAADAVACKLKSETKSTLSSTSMGNTSSRQYAVGLDKDGYLSVNIPWSDTDTTYSAGTGLSLSGTTFSLSETAVTAGSYGPSSNSTPSHSGTFSVPYITVDKYGRVTAASTKTITLPAAGGTSDGNDKVTNTLATTTKFYLTGTSSATTNTGSQYFDTNIYSDTTAGKLVAKTMYASDGFFQSSDETLKDFGENISIDFEALKTIPKKYFTWKNDDKLEIGTGAQSLQKIYPELVTESEGKLTVAYDKLSVIALAAVDKLYDEKKDLEERVERLEELIKQLV